MGEPWAGQPLCWADPWLGSLHFCTLLSPSPWGMPLPGGPSHPSGLGLHLCSGPSHGVSPAAAPGFTACSGDSDAGQAQCCCAKCVLLCSPHWGPHQWSRDTLQLSLPLAHTSGVPECHSHPSASAGTSSLAQPPPPALALWGPSCPSWPCPLRPAPLYPLPAVCSPRAWSSLCNVVVFIPMFPTQQLSLSTELCPVPGTGKATQTACLPGVSAPGVGPATDL